MIFTSTMSGKFIMEGPDDQLLFSCVGVISKARGTTPWASLADKGRFSEEYLDWVGADF